MLDEPTNDLDEEWGEEVMRLVDEWHTAGKTILLVTHNPAYFHRSQECLRMRAGKLTPYE